MTCSVSPVEAGEVGEQLVSGMHHAIAALARTGNHVVADHVLVDPRWVNECARLFADLPAYLVAVRCPLPILEERERARADRRTPGQARGQFERVHAYALYDLELDTSMLSPQECATRIKDRLAGSPPDAFRRLVARR